LTYEATTFEEFHFNFPQKSKHFQFQKSEDRVMAKKIAFYILAALLLVVCTVMILSYSKNVSQKNEYQDQLRKSLISVQIQIDDAIDDKDNNSRADIRTIALEYEKMGTVYSIMSSQLFSNSFLDSGEWGTISRVLLGNNSPSTLFQAFSAPLSEEEINFLSQLSMMNQSLLSEIADDSVPQGIQKMSINSLEKILINYHQNTLKEFLASW